jgi:hypothetical protein
VSGENIHIGGEYGMDRLQTDFENAWRASSKAIEGIALLLLSILIVGLQTCLKGLLALYRWIDQSSTWLVPGKYTWQLDTRPDNTESGITPVRAETALPGL